MLRLSFIFFGLRFLLATIWMPVKSWNPLQCQLQNQKKVLKTISAFLIAVKAELIWYILSHIYLAKNSERKLRYQLNCFLENNGLFGS